MAEFKFELPYAFNSQLWLLIVIIEQYLAQQREPAVFTLTPPSFSPCQCPQDLHVYKPVSLMQEDGCVCSQGRWPWCFAMHMAHRLPLQQGVRTDEAALEQSVLPFAFELYCLAAWMATLLLMLNVKGWILNKNMFRSVTLRTTFNIVFL